MTLNYYRMGILDQPKSSWVAHEVLQTLKPKKNPDMPPVFYQFFSPPDANTRLKPSIQKLQCKVCGLFDSDKVFAKGFTEARSTIRFKQEMGWTDDNFFVLNDRVKDVLAAAKVGGFKTTPAGGDGWHVLQVTNRVDAAKGMFTEPEEICEKCGRGHRDNFNIFATKHLTLPKQTNTFFTTKQSTMAAPETADHEILLTGDVVEVLQQAKVTGPYLNRLWTDDELKQRDAMNKKGKRNWSPPGMNVYLKGK